MTTPAAWGKSMMPEASAVRAMARVAELDWMTAVSRVPASA
jgi:hypothetical protein